ncbi:unnamed protein product [Euphydryas editha]|uniref:Transposase n=1 Tax=Euphydryas editha TaxID=104508 RepID=A0AAU9TPV4_EUPED|nr:unnamed protein product [Euphydryas editha]
MLDRFRTAQTLGNILFSDETNFHIDGYVNKQNMRYWYPNNPRERSKTFKLFKNDSLLQLHPGYNNRTLFQQDGTTPHKDRESMEKLGLFYANKLISKFGEIPWLPRLSDLVTLSDFF